MEPDDSPGLPAKLKDCGSFEVESTELFIVEGDSAAKAVEAARNRKLQAVMPIQGKPLNPLRSSRELVAEYPCWQDIISAMGCGWDTDFDLSKIRYERVVLLFDPDADGIHGSMLVLIFFYRWMRPLLEAGRIHLVRAPLYEITYDGVVEPIYLVAEDARINVADRLISEGKTNVVKKRFRGLESIGPAILRRYCVNPTTRNSAPMQVADAEAAIEVFSPEHK
jgi:DNA gyrase/topoisomerase IV subunit B